MNEPLSKSNVLASKVIFAAMTILRDGGGQMKAADIFDAIPQKLTLDDWAQEVIESNGLARWRTYVHFFSVDAVKAGYLLKTKGIWQITSSGVQALSLGELGYFLAAREGYRAWKRQQLNSPDIAAPQGSDADDASVAQEPPEDQFERLRKEVNSVLAAEILEVVKTNSWQFFERLVVQLLLAMGYGGTGGMGLAL